MSPLVIDASVVLKWVLTEPDAAAALSLRGRYHLLAPEFLLFECANTFWKRVRRKELSADEAKILMQGLLHADIEFVSMRSDAVTIAGLSIELDHPAYDCAYIALALERQCRFATADRRLVAQVARARRVDVVSTVIFFTDLLI